MPQITSNNGTTIAYDRTGQGPALVIVGGVLGDRSQQAGLAQLLAEHFTVYNFDRRGHGESGFTPPYIPRIAQRDCTEQRMLAVRIS
jgi:pimeloyl-ACP methyl ester carboxylesterase